MKQAVTFEWYDHAHQYQRTLAEELGAALFGLSPVGVDSWSGTHGEVGGKSDGPGGTRWEDFDYASTPEQGDEP